MPTKAEKAYSCEWYRKAGETGFTTQWMGIGIVKNPLDLWIYQEIIWQTKPTLIIETGAFVGGSALYLAHVLDATGRDGRIISIDIATDRPLPEHDRINFVLGASSTDPAVVALCQKEADGQRVMVILDSDHSRQHVLHELRVYAPLVTRGCYLIVEDSNRDGYYLGGGYPDGGPREALKEFQPKNKGFEADADCERLGFTQNPGGYLCRVR